MTRSTVAARLAADTAAAIADAAAGMQPATTEEARRLLGHLLGHIRMNRRLKDLVEPLIPPGAEGSIGSCIGKARFNALLARARREAGDPDPAWQMAWVRLSAAEKRETLKQIAALLGITAAGEKLLLRAVTDAWKSDRAAGLQGADRVS